MKNRTLYIAVIIALVTLGSCQKEEVYTGPCNVKIRAYLQDEVSVTRDYSDIAETDTFEAELFISNGTVVNSTTLTKDEGSTAPSANIRLEAGDYWFYGYAPKGEGATFTMNSSEMTVPNIPGLGDKDYLIIRTDDTLTIEQEQKFATVYLKMDHMLAKITPYFYLDETYAEMRSIRIKKVEFMIDGASTYTATATYDVSKVPFSYTLQYQSDGTSTNLQAVAYDNESPTENLTTTKGAQSYGECYLCPNQPIAGLNMTVTYDVYDTEGQLVRPGAEATNKMQIKVSGITLAKLDAGKNYQLNIRIVPTYLYVLSDNDEESVLIIP